MHKTLAGLSATFLLMACQESATTNQTANVAANGVGPTATVPLDDTVVVDATANNSAAPANAANAVDTSVTDEWVGKWVGVEGLALDIAKDAQPGQYMLTVTLLDGTNTYWGTADGKTIRFTRNGKEERVRKAKGADTGLKYLAEKDNCLMIQEGEGFCRG